MAGASLFTLIDDIATLLDDVSVMTKVAAQKTAGVLGDDLALNAGQVVGVNAERELPVVWAVAKGSFINKLILVPSALLISALMPKLIIVLLMIGGLYLCFEGAEKLVHKFLVHDDAQHHAELVSAINNPDIDMVAFEQDKIKGAIRTDFILSAEIVVIALGTMANTTFINQVAVLSIIAIVMTVGVYGIVAGIVKLDDVGFWLLKKQSRLAKFWGKILVASAPKLMKFLSFAGTIAMFMVGGGILAHGIPVVHHAIEHLALTTGSVSGLTSAGLNAVFGLLAGLVVVLAMLIGQKLLPKTSY